MEAADSAAPAAGDAANPFASLFQAPASTPAPATSAAPAAGHAPNTAPLPNPWASAGAGAAPGAAGAQPAGAIIGPRFTRLLHYLLPAPLLLTMISQTLSCLGLATGIVMQSMDFVCSCCTTGPNNHSIPEYARTLRTGLGMLGAGLPGLGGLGGADGASNLDGMMQAMQNPGMQQLMQQLMGQPGFMEVRVPCLTGLTCGCGPMWRAAMLSCRPFNTSPDSAGIDLAACAWCACVVSAYLRLP